MDIHLMTARKYLTESFNEFEGIELFTTNLALLLAEAEALGASKVASNTVSEPSTASPKGKGRGNPYATMLKIISAIGSGKTQAIVDMATELNIVTVNNIKGAKTLELWEKSEVLKDLADGKAMSLMDLVTKAKTLGKNTAVSGVVYGLLSTEAVQMIIDKCMPLCPAK